MPTPSMPHRSGSPLWPSEPSRKALHPTIPGSDHQDWLGELRGWINLCHGGLEPREAWRQLHQGEDITPVNR
jgi:hypothetical protein